MQAIDDALVNPVGAARLPGALRLHQGSPNDEQWQHHITGTSPVHISASNFVADNSGMLRDQMNREPANRRTRVDRNSSGRDEPWFATFTFLDVSSTISSSQLRRLLRAVSALYRMTFRRPA